MLKLYEKKINTLNRRESENKMKDCFMALRHCCTSTSTQSVPKRVAARAAGRGASFQESLRVVLAIGQLFAVMPIYGVSSRHSEEVKFVKVSWKCVYTALMLSGQLFMTLTCVIEVFYADDVMQSITSTVFYGTACLTMVAFAQTARRWPALLRFIGRVEEVDPASDGRLVWRCNVTCVIILSMSFSSTVFIGRVEEVDPASDGRLVWRCNVTCVIILSMSFLEHLLSILSDVYWANACSPSPVDTQEEFYRLLYPWIFRSLPYNPLLAVMCQIFHIQATFTWNFSDLFVICISYYLIRRLQLVNKKLHAICGKKYGEGFWRATREQYGRATQLVRRVDRVISGVVFISFANNLFFICLQLFHTLETGKRGKSVCLHPVPEVQPVAGFITTLYFSFSLVYLLTRSVSMSLIAAQVHTASTVPAPVLYNVSSSEYCEEVQRFVSQVNGEKVALSGLQFFSVTRGLLLTVAGTIVTYELVMFQINSPGSRNYVTPDPSIVTNISSVFST
ncbi:gustatory receptor for sugar taste 64e [Plutella xylostella]|uniref:gustatory receptor for sugar taste 64e n=1 Tax=Plutella xylostella TaxID=51655 RepID=UPI00203228DA|nr:gustatory receptor for sugar taste 64e [Plutella xylostella]